MTKTNNKKKQLLETIKQTVIIRDKKNDKQRTNIEDNK